MDKTVPRSRYSNPHARPRTERTPYAVSYTHLGHLQINKNVIINLTELHNALSSSPKFPFYSAAYFKALPFIVELRNSLLCKRGNGRDGVGRSCIWGRTIVDMREKEKIL